MNTWRLVAVALDQSKNVACMYLQRQYFSELKQKTVLKLDYLDCHPCMYVTIWLHNDYCFCAIEKKNQWTMYDNDLFNERLISLSDESHTF
jgi:hypothetical protein